jgi:hypothetical protein
MRAVSSARISSELADFACTARNQPIRMSCAIPRASMRSVLTSIISRIFISHSSKDSCEARPVRPTTPNSRPVAGATLPRRRAPYFAKVPKGLQLGCPGLRAAMLVPADMKRTPYGWLTTPLTPASQGADLFPDNRNGAGVRERRRLADAGVTHKRSYKVSDAVGDYMDEIQAEKSPSAHIRYS